MILNIFNIKYLVNANKNTIFVNINKLYKILNNYGNF